MSNLVLEEHYSCFEEIIKKALNEDSDAKIAFLTVSKYLTTNSMAYDEILAKLNRDLGIVVVLKADYNTLMKRIVGRVICKDCGSVYNTLTGVNTPSVENICDKCGGSLYKRSDDNEESFKTRYETYLEKTKPLIDYYKSIGNLHFVNSTDMNEMLMETEEMLQD